MVTTAGGAKFATVKQGACPAADFTGKLGSCYPAAGKYVIVDYTAYLPNGQVSGRGQVEPANSWRDICAHARACGSGV